MSRASSFAVSFIRTAFGDGLKQALALGWFALSFAWLLHAKE